MFRSVFLRKMVFLVLVALCASALLSATLFTLGANEMLKTNTEDKLISKAQAMSLFVSEYITNERSSGNLYDGRSLDAATKGYSEPSVLDAYYVLYDATGAPIKTSVLYTNHDVDFFNQMDGYARANMLTNTSYLGLLIGRVQSEDKKTTSIIVQAPIVVNDQIIAYLVIGNEYSLENSIAGSFGSMLLLSTFVVALFIKPDECILRPSTI